MTTAMIKQMLERQDDKVTIFQHLRIMDSPSVAHVCALLDCPFEYEITTVDGLVMKYNIIVH